MSKKRALITGLSGFTGYYVAKALESDYEIFGLGATPANINHYYQADLANINQLEKVIDEMKPHAILHLAAVAFVAHSNSNEFYTSNLIGTRNLLQACYSTHPSIETILIASSANVYGNQSEGVLSETSRVNPSNDYAVSKLAMEFMANLWSEKLPIIIARPFNYTGVGQSEQFLIPKIVAHFKAKAKTIELGNIDVWRDFNDVRNVANAYQLLLNKKPIGETINICSGKSYSVREIIHLAEAISGHNMSITVNPEFVRENEVKMLRGDITKLNLLTNGAKNIPFENTLAWMLNTTNA